MELRRIPDWTPDELAHKAIKGQKKGVRRFQYANGTYTKEGNERYRPKKNIVTKLTGIKVTEEGLLLAGIGATVVSTVLLSGAVTLPSIGAAASAVSTGVGQSAVATLMANETFKNMVLPAIGAMSVSTTITKLLDDD